MLRPLFAVCLLLLALCGCGAAAPEPTAPTPTTQILETMSDNTPKLTDLPQVRQMLRFDGNLLFLSGQGSTTLTLSQPDNLELLASLTLPQTLTAADLQLHGNTLSYYDEHAMEHTVLDAELNTTRIIALPKNAIGKPLLSQTTNTLYYQTEDAIIAWDLSSGIRRPLLEHRFTLTLTALHREDTILQATLSDGKTLFLDTATGALLHSHPTEITLYTTEHHYFASFPQGDTHPLVFGSYEGEAQLFLPQDLFAQVIPIPEKQGALSVSSDGTLQYYDLTTGTQGPSLALGQHRHLESLLSLDSTLFCLVYDAESDSRQLLTWAPEAATGSPSYCSPYPQDEAGLALCQSYASQLSQKYGLEILIAGPAAQTQPWDFTLEPETLVPVLHHQLTLVDSLLSRYPESLFSQTAAHFDSVKLCLVRSIRGTAASGSLAEATGVQFLQDGVAYVCVAATAYAEQALYHEFYHAMETHILTHSTALDQWNTLNPSGFSYDYDFLTNATRNSGIYLQPADRSFIDTYSMSYPKEDRARVFEYAMLPGQESLFQSETMQSKLSTLCRGLRESFGLKNAEALPWEQYLD